MLLPVGKDQVLWHMTGMERNTKIHATKVYVAECANRHAQQRASEENTSPQVSVLASDVRQSLLKRNSIEGTFVNKKKSKTGRGKVYRTMHVGLGGKLQEAESIIAKENTDIPIDCSPPCGQEMPEENFQEVVLNTGLGLRRFHSCKGKIKKKRCPLPKDFAFHMQVLQIWKDQNTMEWHHVTAMFTSTLPCHV